MTCLSLSLPQEVISSVAGKRLALIGFEREEASDLATALESAQAFARKFDRAAAAPGDAVLRHSDLVVVKVRHEADENDWISSDHLARNDKPLLFVGPPERFFQHAPAGQALPYDFLITPWRPEEMVTRVYHMLSEAAKKSARKKIAVAGTMRVLVADDDATTTTLVSAAINKYGMVCEVACDGGAAIEAARRTLPNAAVLDVNMPHLGGFEVLATLKSEPRTSRIRVMMLTSRQQETDIIRAFGLGADDYVVKPFSPMELIARLKRILSIRYGEE